MLLSGLWFHAGAAVSLRIPQGQEKANGVAEELLVLQSKQEIPPHTVKRRLKK